MRPDNVSIDNRQQSHVLQTTDRAPVGRFATAWLRGNEGFFRVTISVIGPHTEKPQDDLPLADCKAEPILEAISNLVKSLKKKSS